MSLTLSSPRSCAVILSAIAACSAPATGQDAPKVWAEFMPRGAAGYDARGYSPSDSMFQRMVMYNAAYPSINWHTLPPSGTLDPSRWTPTTDDAVDLSNLPAPGILNVNLVGRRLAIEALRRGFNRSDPSYTNGHAPNLALNLIRTGMPRDDVRTVVISTPMTVITTGHIVVIPGKPGSGGAGGNEPEPDRSNYIEYPDLYAAQRDPGNSTPVLQA